MPKSENQRAKLIYLAKIFTERTDEAHPISREDIMAALGEYGVDIERKTLYSDIETLREAGMDIILDKSSPRNSAYYLASREFELPELQLLINAVACSKFITERKSRTLIKKLSRLASVHQGAKLRREAIVSEKVKAKNEHIYYNVDILQEAIAAKKKILFKYFSYDCNKKKVYRDDKKDYVVSPLCLTWKDEQYYCTGYHERRKTISNFRIDKMENVRITDENCTGVDGFDASRYSERTFGMFAGEDERVTMRFSNSLAGVVLDRFGMDTLLTKDGDDHFTVCVEVTVSSVFFGWVMQFGQDAEIIKPNSVREQFCEQLRSIGKNYRYE